LRLFITNRGLRIILLLTILGSGTGANLFSQDNRTLKVEESYNLPPVLSEISGMICIRDTVFAINDSGNGSFIYMLDASDFSRRATVYLRNIRNIDWEELCYFDGDLYIGDFGNNLGNRKDLAIYRLPLKNLFDHSPAPGKIQFNYAAQVSFKIMPGKHPWDCEAMVVNNEGIWLFSKNWKDRYTILYRINDEIMHYSATALDTLKIDFLVTGSFLDSESDELFLCGYTKKSTYLAVIRDYTKTGFSTDPEVYHIPELENMQVESVYVKDNYIYLASERTSRNQRIYKIIKP